MNSIATIGIFFPSSDHGEYIGPIDNLIKNGNYSLRGDGRPYAGRLPGFFVPYFFFREFLNPFVAGQTLGAFILIFSVISSAILFKLMLELTESSFLSWLVVLFGCILPFYWHWDWILHPFSLACSCLILLVYFLYRLRIDLKSGYVFWAGFFLAWLFMLRGFTLLFIPVCLMYLIWILRKQGADSMGHIQTIFLFVLPLLISELVWVTRNYLSFGKFIPLQTAFVKPMRDETPEYGATSHVKYSMMKVREMISAWGGDNFWYFPNADMNWFTDENEKETPGKQFPSAVTSVISPAELVSLRNLIQASFVSGHSFDQQTAIEDEIEKKSVEYRERFMRAHTAYSLFVSPIKRLKNFLIKNPTQDWIGPPFARSTLIQKGLKLFSILTYAVLLAMLPLLCFFVVKNWRRIDLFCRLLFMLVLVTLFTFTFVINTSHYSYFIVAYIPLLMLTVLSFFRPEALLNRVGP